MEKCSPALPVVLQAGAAVRDGCDGSRRGAPHVVQQPGGQGVHRVRCRHARSLPRGAERGAGVYSMMRRKGEQQCKNGGWVG